LFIFAYHYSQPIHNYTMEKHELFYGAKFLVGEVIKVLSDLEEAGIISDKDYGIACVNIITIDEVLRKSEQNLPKE